mmetsp:Transcript_26916/g.48739  ORF Transcript_26916/g.48739 Transcript_26916/m.48739 type:complete len:334 (-) Transcript_26916:694-1695(-)
MDQHGDCAQAGAGVGTEAGGADGAGDWRGGGCGDELRLYQLLSGHRACAFWPAQAGCGSRCITRGFGCRYAQAVGERLAERRPSAGGRSSLSSLNCAHCQIYVFDVPNCVKIARPWGRSGDVRRRAEHAFLPSEVRCLSTAAQIFHHVGAHRLLASLTCGVDHPAQLSQINPTDQTFHRTNGGRPHREVAQAHGGETDGLNRTAGVFAAEAERRASVDAAVHDAFEEGQETDVERVIATTHPFVFPVCGKEELFQVVTTNGKEVDFLIKLLRRKAQGRCFQHGADFDLRGQRMAQDHFTLNRFVHLGLRGGVFFILGDEREHDGQRAPVGSAQ